MSVGQLPPVTPTNIRPVDHGAGDSVQDKPQLRTPDAPRTGDVPRSRPRGLLAGTIITAATAALLATTLNFGTAGGALADSHDVPPEAQVTCPAPDADATPAMSYITPEAASASPVAPVSFDATPHDTPLEGRIEQGDDGRFSIVPLRVADWAEVLKGDISNIAIVGRFSPELLQDGMLTNLDLNSLPYSIRDGQASIRIDSDAHFADVFAEGVPRTAHGTIVIGKAPGAGEDDPADHLILMMAESGPGSEMWLDGARERSVEVDGVIQRGVIHLGPATAEAVARLTPGDDVQINGRFSKLDDGSFRLVSVLNMQAQTPVADANIIEPTMSNGFMCVGDRQLPSFSMGAIDATGTVSRSVVMDAEQGRAYMVQITEGDEPSLKGFEQRYDYTELSGVSLELDGATTYIGSGGERRELEILAGISGHNTDGAEYWQVTRDNETGTLYRVEFQTGDERATVVARMQPLDEH